MSEFPFLAWYWTCDNPVHTSPVRMPKRTFSNMFTDPVEYLQCLKCGRDYDSSNPAHEPEQGKVRWLWNCQACGCKVSWKEDWCHKPGCGGAWLAGRPRKYDGGKPSEWPSEHDKPSPEEIEEAQKQKDAGQPHKPYLEGCPETCPGTHDFQVKILVEDEIAVGEWFTATASIDPPIDPSKSEGTIQWGFGEGWELADFEGAENPVYRPGNETKIRIQAGMTPGTLQLMLIFTYEGENDVGIPAETVSIELIEPKREPGEVEGSKTSTFKLERTYRWKPPYADDYGRANYKDLSRAYVLHDFEVGSASADDYEKMPGSGTTSLFGSLAARIGEWEEIVPVVHSPDGSWWVRRKLHLRGFTDSLGPDPLNDSLRNDRPLAVFDELSQVFGLADHIIDESELNEEEKAIFAKWPRYLASNKDAKGRGKNRSVLLVEILRTEQRDTPADEKKKQEERFKDHLRYNLIHHWSAWRDEVQGQSETLQSCMLGHIDFLDVRSKGTEFLKSGQTWSAWSRSYCRNPDNRNERFWRKPDVQRFIRAVDLEVQWKHDLWEYQSKSLCSYCHTQNVGAEKRGEPRIHEVPSHHPGEEPPLVEIHHYCDTLTTWALSAFGTATSPIPETDSEEAKNAAEAAAKAEFMINLRRIDAEVDRGVEALSKQRLVLGGAMGGDWHRGTRDLAIEITRLRGVPSVYSCYQDDKWYTILNEDELGIDYNSGMPWSPDPPCGYPPWG
jgi:hypothetical protein